MNTNKQNNSNLTPPFWGTKCITHIPIESIIPYLNLNLLGKKLWGMNQSNKKEIQTIINKLTTENKQKNIIRPQAVYGYFPCKTRDNELIIYTDVTCKKESCRFVFPHVNAKCITDYFHPQNDNKHDVVALQLVTTGQAAATHVKKLFKQNEYQQYLYWHGFNVAIATATAELVHKHIRTELDFTKDEPKTIDDIFKQKYRGARLSLGYPSCPNLEDQEKILKLLDAERIGVTLTESYQLVPEESTSAFVILD